MEKDLGVSQEKIEGFLFYVRTKFGRKSVQPYWRERLPEINDEASKYFTAEVCPEFTDNKGQQCSLPSVWCHDVPNQLKETALLRGYTEPGSLTLKVGVDSGKGETKWIASIFDSAELRREKADNAKRKRRNTVVSRHRSAVGPLKTICLATVPHLDENHHNISVMHRKLKLDELRKIKHTGDLKVMNIQIGVGPCSSLFPCGFCEAIKRGKCLIYDENTRLRTVRNISENNDKHVRENIIARLKGEAQDPTAKNNYSCVQQPIIKPEEHDGLILAAFPPPMLHSRLGIVGKCLEWIHNEWEKIEEGADGVNSFLRSLHINKKEYFGTNLEGMYISIYLPRYLILKCESASRLDWLCLFIYIKYYAGNECRTVLNHLDDLESVLPPELTIFVDFLRCYKAVEDTCGGFTLFPGWKGHLDR